nr:TolC family outer membrane protein [Sphingobium limneticum]
MQRTAYHYLLAGLVACAGSAVQAQVAGPDAGLERRRPPSHAVAPVAGEIRTLSDAIRMTYWNNPTLLSQRARVRASDNRLPQARAAYGLNLSAQGSYGYQRDRFQTALGWAGNQGWSSTATAILTQPLFTSGRSAGGEKIAIAEIAFARDTLRLTETQTLLDTVTAYVSVIRDRENVSIAKENLGLLGRQLTDSRARYEVRDITSADLQQIETRVELGQAQLLLAQGRLAGSEAQFVQLVGMAPSQLAPPTELDIGLGTIDQAYALSERRSPVIRAAQSREKISRASVDAVRAEFGPDINLRGTGSYGSVTPYADNLRATELRGEVVLTMPLLDGNLRLSRLREVQEANSADWRLIDQAVRDTNEAIASSWQQLATTRDSLANYERAVAAARKAYDGAVEQETAGARTTLDVLDLARDLLNVRNGYVSARADEYILRAGLLAAVGELDATQMVPDVERYDPNVHFEKVRGRGDTPLLTPLLSGLDHLGGGPRVDDRPITDPGAGVRITPPGPIPPAPRP